ncbi:hypothetical protein EDD98_4465 [Streptomyces sp. PanSC19]|uniref:hypothetical protein n=1 Tax=Streptomyces sp. PanSC19 TaxID=1520455 RepID=UPI000F49E1DE|nr:hypothetical protein [Streptomyces sp. PanSC19]ROQ35408.1 hypothetical protein EDD98_4465 [Streptomyces sp. PanSC19]
MQKTALAPYARLSRAHHGRHVLTSTVDVSGTAHWLLAEHAPKVGGDTRPFDAVVVSVHDDGAVDITELGGVRARWPHLDRLPDGGFVVASSRSRRGDKGPQVQVFDVRGRETASFTVGDAIEHMLVDGTGELWVGHFDENPDGIRRWSATGQLRWASEDIPGAGWIMDCYALNVSGSVAWACPYTDFPLLEIRPGLPVKARSNTVRGAHAVAVHEGWVAFVGGYGEERDRIVYGGLTETSVEVGGTGVLTSSDGAPLGRRRVVGRGCRVYVQAEPFTEWGVFDLSW